ncbi:uncharacterized protein LOC110461886 [Mizuhopecten yessoensis]|uniref:uncharacterized protein LOC110461886 n=1 Tax=Mizuhopecten yessoensis TaxID=6573 RepID=UPI000B45ECB2|nr:uncharacterized protein LOC110461886 [Mizuhopecten yessoensis]
MFVLYRWMPGRILYHISSAASTSDMLLPGQSSRRDLMSPVSLCCCNHRKYLPRVVNHKLQFSKKYANSAPKYWNGMKTDEKIENAKKMHDKIKSSLPEKTLVVYTDGSMLDSKRRVGPCGAGAVIYENDETIAKLSVPVSPQAPNDLAEYTAIKIALSNIIKNFNFLQLEKIQIFCDNQHVIKGCLNDTKEAEHADIVASIRQKMDVIISEGVEIAIDWVPSNSGVDGNDLADKLAKRAAIMASTLPLESTLITERDVQRSMEQFKSVTGSKGRNRDYSQNVMLAILMKNKDQKRMTGANSSSSQGNQSPPDSESGPVVNMNNRRVLFTGMYQDDLHRLVSKATMHGCTVDKKLSSVTDFVVHGLCDTTDKEEVQQLAYKIGVQCVSGDDWEKALSKCPKLGLPSYSEDNHKHTKLKKKRPCHSGSKDGNNRKDKKGKNSVQKKKR